MFVPDEIIECVSEVPGTLLLKGLYTVVSCSKDFVYLKEIDGGWMASRFVSVGARSISFNLNEIA
jgi:hypothetical protein